MISCWCLTSSVCVSHQYKITVLHVLEKYYNETKQFLPGLILSVDIRHKTCKPRGFVLIGQNTTCLTGTYLSYFVFIRILLTDWFLFWRAWNAENQEKFQIFFLPLFINYAFLISKSLSLSLSLSLSPQTHHELSLTFF